ncbi:PASTA domain-containing protein [Streptomyces sp. M7]|uniref:PASTA domain-containing protein n=1 Tax=Streptomyces sp. M7 TaxID=255705 RepID=UPI0011C04B59|nr:PASTA domain-containing protein [Streptomyces sp. M7]
MKQTIVIPLATLTLLAAACQPRSGETNSDGTADTTKKPQASTPTTTSPTPTSKEAPTANPFTLPSLTGKTQDSAVDLLRDHHLRLGLITNRSAYKEMSLPSGGNFGSWIICFTDPAQGSWITNSTEIYLYLAKTASACVESAPKPPPKKTPPAPTPATREPDSSGPHTCSRDGSQSGYACTSTGKVVVEGEYCASADHGRTLKASNGRMATCEDYNGWRWNA